MSKDKYKHAMEVIENWERVEEYHININKEEWLKPGSLVPDPYHLGDLNDPKKFRIKREPRRVFVNYYTPWYIDSEQIGVMHLSKEGAEAEANDEACEVAVEFVEVVKS